MVFFTLRKSLLIVYKFALVYRYLIYFKVKLLKYAGDCKAFFIYNFSSEELVSLTSYISPQRLIRWS